MNLLITIHWVSSNKLLFLSLLLLTQFIRIDPVWGQNFNTSSLKGVSITNPTSLQFGPDGRLYIAQQNGLIKIFTIVRNGANNYSATATETVSLINQIPNHNDNGTVNTGVTTRQVTSLLLSGTAANPIMYVTSSDSRIGGPSGDLNLDTNSGILSKLTKTASSWDKVDLIRGFPRSEENHSTNGMQLDPKTNTLYLTIGGFTNAGSPSANFAYICEYALSASIVAIDLSQVEALPMKGSGNTKYKYDLPTVDDPTRSNNPDGTDAGDPFGGNDGLNQAKIVIGGPVKVHSTGYRNAYDLVITKTPGKAGRMYTVDNGPNQGWGGGPANEGATGKVTNNYVVGEPGSSGPGVNDPQVNNLDGFHYIGNLDTYEPGSYYAGHPNPIRANPAGAGLYTRSGSTGVWRTSKTGSDPLPADWPPVPVNLAHPIEGDYQSPGEADNSLLTFPTSTNGLTEYTASNFNNALKGSLLAACYNGNIYKISLNSTGDQVLNSKGGKKLITDAPFAANFGSQPLDIIAQGDNDVFPGSVWAATYGANAITIFEPGDFISCSSQYSSTLDEDGDGYTNADEIDNQTNPCSASSKPADFDGDKVSDLKDTDDDNDQIADNVDYFAQDAQNGLTTSLPIKYDLFNNYPGTGFFGLGFTGLMSNKIATNDYSKLYNEDNLIAGGAVGAFSVVAVSAGDALGALNTQENAFQFGLNVTSNTGPFTIQARILGNFFDNKPPQGNQSQGIFIGTGDQDNYLKIVLNANGGKSGIEVVFENAGTPVSYQFDINGGIPASTLDLFLAVNPVTGTVQPKYSRDGGTVFSLGTPIQISGALLTALQGSPALAVGIMATSRNASPFTATWDFINVTSNQATALGTWQTLTANSGAIIGREENAYVQAGNKFYLIGGRGIKAVQEYDPINKTWVNKSNVPMELHHFQAVTLNGLIYVVGAFTGSYPRETPVAQIYIYNPVTDKWINGPSIPQARRRGSAGVVVYNNKIYLISGILDGHWSGWVNWFDEYDPATNTWKTLPNAPRARDHFHAAIVNSKLYVAGGRRSSASTGQTFTFTVPEVDVYDFTTSSWSTLPSSSNIPTQRAGAGTVVLGNELLVIGGESTQPAGHKETEALNVTTNTWRRLADLQQGRHGTQAIESNNGIYIVTGAGNQGGSPLLTSQEAYYVSGSTIPAGTALSQSKITAPGTLDFGQVATASTTSKTLILSNTTGNQAIVVTGITKTGDAAFSHNTSFSLPFVIPAGGSVTLSISFSPTTSGTKTGSVLINHSGTGGTTTIGLNGQAGGSSVSPLYLINGGGPALTLENKSWEADKYFTGGKIYTNNQIADIANTNSDQLYKTERSSATPFGYAFPVAAGTYRVNLHFAEIYWGATGGGAAGVGKRIFGVNLEGGTVELANFDIYAEAGAMKVLVKTFDVTVTDGVLNIDFSVKVDQPKISAIEILPLTNPANGQITANPTSLHFFSQQAGTISQAQTITLTNTSSTTQQINTVTLTGANSAEFTHNFSNAVSLSANASAIVAVSFKPASLGTKVAQLSVTYSGSTTPLTISLTGEGTNNPNQAPIANAGTDKAITLPTNSVGLNGSGTDPDGTIQAYSWSQVSGPNTATFNNKTVASPTVSGLVAGSYVFSLVVKDNFGTSSAADQIVVTVNSTTGTNQQVTGFVLINATTEQAIQPLTNGSVLNLGALPTKALNIQAITNPAKIGSVVFSLSGKQAKQATETAVPYALFGDNNGNYNSWTPAAGSYTLKATPYSGTNGTGTAGSPLTINFTVVNQVARVATVGKEFSSIGSSLRVYPNPSPNGRVKVVLREAASGEVSYKLISATGAMLAHGKRTLKQASTVLSFNFSGSMRQPGVYYLQLQGSKLHEQIKIMRQ
ncbi:malectin domain-containing carbohydrate-binding protein [Adhaeribacter radiodurans]|uniref:Choice-of-anchor D domain-containing protein n=1 Tax=Adhaeribacter radiodurans TaxID=2745197 RepID=A0A7L7LEQ9_9BACT|nr:malectin domain-containing carbohydrate-binding protein [Adhaeribacter radiodurans]QMU31310.1 choice-of-anchor D domain-containing protein [Adhaeribacter radiodurans]